MMNIYWITQQTGNFYKGNLSKIILDKLQNTDCLTDKERGISYHVSIAKCITYKL